MNIREELGARAKHVEEILATFLPEEAGTQKTIFEAMNYSLLAGGKRIRPILISINADLKSTMTALKRLAKSLLNAVRSSVTDSWRYMV